MCWSFEPRHLVEQLAGQMHRGAVSGRRIVRLAGIGLGVGDELLHRMRRRRHRHRHHVRVVADQADRREIGNRIERQGREQEFVHRKRHRLQQHGVAVRVGLGDGIGADRGRAAALVLDHHLLAPDRRQLGGDDARDGVGAAARRKRHDEADEARRKGLRRRGACKRRCKCRGAGKLDETAAINRDRAHSFTLMLAARISGPHLSISDFRNALSFSGGPPTMSPPSASRR